MITHETIVSATIDWLQYTCQEVSWPDDWNNQAEKHETGMWGYTEKYTFPDGRIWLRNPERPEMGNHVILSGSTLDNIEAEYLDSPDNILNFMLDRVKLTRIDLAIDAMRGSLEFDRLEAQLVDKRAKTMARQAHRFEALVGQGDTIYVGSAYSTMRLRIYDKAAEQEVTNLEWTRIELQTRTPKSVLVAKTLREANYNPETWTGIIRGYCDFPDDLDWKRVMSAPAIKLQSHKRKTTKTRKWLMDVCAPALAAYQAVHHDYDLGQAFQAAIKGKTKRG